MSEALEAEVVEEKPKMPSIVKSVVEGMEAHCDLQLAELAAKPPKTEKEAVSYLRLTGYWEGVRATYIKAYPDAYERGLKKGHLDGRLERSEEAFQDAKRDLVRSWQDGGMKVFVGFLLASWLVGWFMRGLLS